MNDEIHAGRGASGCDEMETVVAHESRPFQPWPRFAERRLEHPYDRVPVDPDRPLAPAISTSKRCTDT
jgi:hypothetical protein